MANYPLLLYSFPLEKSYNFNAAVMIIPPDRHSCGIRHAQALVTNYDVLERKRDVMNTAVLTYTLIVVFGKNCEA